jgi:hypothetical protein
MSYFFRVEHDLLRSESFKTLNGSAIKVYLIIGLYSDFGTDWAYPSIRTIAKQAGLSRQTVLTAIAELSRVGLLATTKSKGRSTAYKILRPAPRREKGASRKSILNEGPPPTGLLSLAGDPKTGPESLEVPRPTGPDSLAELVQFLTPAGPTPGPNPEPATRDLTTTIPIPGTPFRLSAEGHLIVAVDLQELLTNQGIARPLAAQIAAHKDPELVAKVLLNALYLQSQGKLQNGPGYIRTGIEEGYELLPQVAHRLESRRRELEKHLRKAGEQTRREAEARQRAEEEAAIALMIEQLGPDELDSLVRRAVALLPEPIVRRNPTLSNPFVRGKVYELAGSDSLS